MYCFYVRPWLPQARACTCIVFWSALLHTELNVPALNEHNVATLYCWRCFSWRLCADSCFVCSRIVHCFVVFFWTTFLCVHVNCEMLCTMFRLPLVCCVVCILCCRYLVLMARQRTELSSCKSLCLLSRLLSLCMCGNRSTHNELTVVPILILFLFGVLTNVLILLQFCRRQKHIIIIMFLKHARKILDIKNFEHPPLCDSNFGCEPNVHVRVHSQQNKLFQKQTRELKPWQTDVAVTTSDIPLFVSQSL